MLSPLAESILLESVCGLEEEKQSIPRENGARRAVLDVQFTLSFCKETPA